MMSTNLTSVQLRVWVLRKVRGFLFQCWILLGFAAGILNLLNNGGKWYLWHANPFDLAAVPALIGVGDIALVLFLAVWGDILIIRVLNGWKQTSEEAVKVRLSFTQTTEYELHPFPPPNPFSRFRQDPTTTSTPWV